MKRIIINETDLTTVTSEITETDVVFVPGFSAAMGVGVEPLTPVLCRTVEEFVANFGANPATFASNQNFPVQTTEVYGFPTFAIPEVTGAGNDANTVWFKSGDPDPSYIYAKELLYSGIPVYYTAVNGGVKTPAEGETPAVLYGITVDDMYHALLNKVYEDSDTTNPLSIYNKDYNIKYITSGGYPTFEYGVTTGQASGGCVSAIVNKMGLVAATRGDCVVLVDHTNNPGRTLTGNNSVFTQINSVSTVSSDINETFMTMVTPWGEFTTTGAYTNVSKVDMPGSFAYMKSLAKSIKTNANWLAIAGVARGLVPNLISLRTNQLLTNGIAEYYQGDEDVCINAITDIKPYGLCIWGNRTLVNQTESKAYATRFLNIRNMLSDIKKQAYLAAQSLMFEQNNDVLWVNFKSLITPLLDKMVSGSGISAYKIIKNESASKTKLSATIRIYPIYAVESFEINIVLTDEEVTVE